MSEKDTLNNVVQDADVGTMADVDEIMKKYDRESNTRIWEGTPKLVVRWITVLFGMFMIVMNMFLKMDERARRPLFLGLVILLVFIYYPAKKGSQKVNHIPWYDIILATLGGICYFFYPLNLEKIVNAGTRIQKVFSIQIGSVTIPLLLVFGIVGTLILVECCRRVVGLPIIFVATAFVIYAFVGGGKDLKTVIYNLFYTTTGILGTPIGVCSTYIALFVIFGAFLEATGVANFFIDCANTVAGWASGGRYLLRFVRHGVRLLRRQHRYHRFCHDPDDEEDRLSPRVCRRGRGRVLHGRPDHAPDHGRCGVPDGGNGRRSL